jgi:hypothetical protein
MGRHAEAVAACRKAIGLDPYYPRGHWFLAPALEQKRELPATIAEPEKMVAISRGGPLDRALPGHAYARAGERTKAFGIPEELKALSEQRYVSPLDIATVHTGLGDREFGIRVAGEGISGTHDADTGTATTYLRRPPWWILRSPSHAADRPPALRRLLRLIAREPGRHRIRFHHPQRPVGIVTQERRIFVRPQVERPDHTLAVDIGLVPDPLAQ